MTEAKQVLQTLAIFNIMSEYNETREIEKDVRDDFIDPKKLGETGPDNVTHIYKITTEGLK